MGVVIKANNVTLPSPVEITASNEIIWSSNTGRGPTGKMVGDVVAEKETFAITWGVLSGAEFNTIKNNLAAGFLPFSITIDGTTTTITQYRGTLTREFLGVFGGVTYYREAQVSIIQQ